ncbi:MAG: L-threonylcarbamoyladenylate synthase, partial [Lachnospira sp.]
METIIKRITNTEDDENIYEQAGEILREGGLVAFPTETVYGLGADALDADASGKIYAAKGRPSDNPLIVHIASVDALYNLAEEIPDKALKLADKFWPGPLTMILKKQSKVPDSITGGLGTVAIRMPSHPVAAELIRSSGVYIAAPSANTSGKPSPTRAEHVINDLSGKIDMIIQDDTVDIGVESTIIDLSEEIPTILRPGYITKEMFEKVIGEVAIDPAI